MGRYGVNEDTYLGTKVEKSNNAEFEGIIPDSCNYGGEINHIEISHERTRHPNEPLTEDAHPIPRSELGKLMWIARIARPGAIYDASAATQAFSEGELYDVSEQK